MTSASDTKTAPFVIGIFRIIGIWLIISTLVRFNNHNTLDRLGVPASATITNKRIDSTEDGTWYYIKYAYQPHGTSSYEREQSVDKPFYNTIQLGAMVKVEYMPSDPAIARLSGTADFDNSDFGFAIVWTAISFLIGFRTWKQ